MAQLGSLEDRRRWGQCRRGCESGAGPGRVAFHLLTPVRPGDDELLICSGSALAPGAVYADATRPGEWIQVQSQPAPGRVRVLRACAGSAPRFHRRGAVWSLVRAAVPWRVVVARPRAATRARPLCPQGSAANGWLGAPRPPHHCLVWVERLVLGGFWAARLDCTACGYAGPALVRADARRPRGPRRQPQSGRSASILRDPGGQPGDMGNVVALVPGHSSGDLAGQPRLTLVIGKSGPGQHAGEEARRHDSAFPEV